MRDASMGQTNSQGNAVITNTLTQDAKVYQLEQLQGQLSRQKAALTNQPWNQQAVCPQFEATKKDVVQVEKSIYEISRQIQQLQESVSELMNDIEKLCLPQSYPDTSR